MQNSAISAASCALISPKNTARLPSNFGLCSSTQGTSRLDQNSEFVSVKNDQASLLSTFGKTRCNVGKHAFGRVAPCVQRGNNRVTVPSGTTVSRNTNLKRLGSDDTQALTAHVRLDATLNPTAPTASVLAAAASSHINLNIARTYIRESTKRSGYDNFNFKLNFKSKSWWEVSTRATLAKPKKHMSQSAPQKGGGNCGAGTPHKEHRLRPVTGAHLE